MGLKDFLVKQGFLTDEGDKTVKTNGSAGNNTEVVNTVAPTFFPLKQNTDGKTDADPAFVTPLQNNSAQNLPDPSFVKFFEDELSKSNLPGPDYFEFRQL